MNWIIPALGLGERFNQYLEQKPFIKVLGKCMIEKVVENLQGNIIIICNQSQALRMENLFLGNKKIKIITSGPTSGAAETISKAIPYLTPNTPFTSVDCDTILKPRLVEKIIKSKENIVWTFIDEKKSGIYSYVEGNIHGEIKSIKEKLAISELASSGIYTFKSPADYKSIWDMCDENYNGETYVSNLISVGLKHRVQFLWQDTENDFYCVGTPYQLENFCQSNKEKNIIVFDLDKTLVVDILKCKEPIWDKIEFMNSLYEMGHHIIIHTARGMKTYNGDIEKIENRWRIEIENWLSEVGAKYNELKFGKPYADLYIDDKAISAGRNLKFDTGFYPVIGESRYHNKIREVGKYLEKTGPNVANEINYYNKIKTNHLFPKIISNEGNKLLMEKIDGETLSKKLLDLRLTKKDLDKVICCLNEIHSSEKQKPNSNKLWLEKLNERWLSNKKLFQQIGMEDTVKDLLKIELDLEFETPIHGDPVFTNIIQKENNIYFIDPRGHNGVIQTHFGPRSYDWAKMYQSLCGYDFILGGFDIPHNYLEDLRTHFLEKIPHYNLKNKTKILLLSMLPLHMDRMDRIIKWTDLIKKI